MEYLIGAKLTQVKKDTEEHILTLTFDHKYKVEIDSSNIDNGLPVLTINDTTCNIEEEV